MLFGDCLGSHPQGSDWSCLGSALWLKLLLTIFSQEYTRNIPGIYTRKIPLWDSELDLLINRKWSNSQQWNTMFCNPKCTTHQKGWFETDKTNLPGPLCPARSLSFKESSKGTQTIEVGFRVPFLFTNCRSWNVWAEMLVLLLRKAPRGAGELQQWS